MTMQEAVIKNIDTDYSYQLAKRMEQFRSNEKLGYRPAGSKAEFLTGEMLKDEMQKLGLSDVCKNAVTVDGWEFKNAELTFETKEGKRHTALLGAYQTDFVTDGEQAFSLMYLGKGTEADYEGKDVTGKLVLVDINQRDEWWINYPVYQAHLKGAAAVIAVQCGTASPPFQRSKDLQVPWVLPYTKHVANPLRQACLAWLHCGFSCDFPACRTAPHRAVPHAGFRR